MTDMRPTTGWMTLVRAEPAPIDSPLGSWVHFESYLSWATCLCSKLYTVTDYTCTVERGAALVGLRD